MPTLQSCRELLAMDAKMPCLDFLLSLYGAKIIPAHKSFNHAPNSAIRESSQALRVRCIFLPKLWKVSLYTASLNLLLLLRSHPSRVENSPNLCSMTLIAFTRALAVISSRLNAWCRQWHRKIIWLLADSVPAHTSSKDGERYLPAMRYALAISLRSTLFITCSNRFLWTHRNRPVCSRIVAQVAHSLGCGRLPSSRC